MLTSRFKQKSLSTTQFSSSNADGSPDRGGNKTQKKRKKKVPVVGPGFGVGLGF